MVSDIKSHGLFIAVCHVIQTWGAPIVWAAQVGILNQG